MRNHILIIFLLFAWWGCGGSKTTNYLRYGDAAQSLYAKALEDFYSDNCIDAEPTLRDVRRKYPYSRFAALAELRLADCLFNDGKYLEAIQAYDQFARRHPSHAEVPYARFRVVESYHEQIPADWFLVPPAYERDQGPAQQTLNSLRKFIAEFPKDPHIPKANRMQKEVMELLARHELCIAKFYWGRDRYKAVVARLNTLLRSYPQTEVEPEALLMLGDTYLELHDQTRAKKAFKELIQRYPGSGYAAKARDRLGS